MSNQIVKKETNAIANVGGFATQADMQWLNEAMNEDCAGIELQLDRIKIPAGGSTAFEIPSADGDDTEMVKEMIFSFLVFTLIHLQGDFFVGIAGEFLCFHKRKGST